VAASPRVADKVHELAERGHAAAVLAADLALAHDQVADRQAGLADRGAQQQVARHGARHAHRQPGVARRRRTAGPQDAQDAGRLARHQLRRVGVEARLLQRELQAVDQHLDIAIDAVFRWILDPDLVPARIHLLGDQHGERRVDALSHLGARHGHDH
jgi:hypothetical protein